MSRHKRKRHAHRRLPDATPLQSIQRDDGLWESIEQDEETLLDRDHDSEGTHCSVTPRNIRLKSIGTQTLPTDHPTIPSSPGAAKTHMVPARTDPLACVHDLPLPRPCFSAAAATNEAPTKRRRGRPPKKKRSNEPSVHRRVVRFSDPDPPDAEPQPRSRDSHVFVRLLKVLVTIGDPHQNTASKADSSTPRQVEFVWNNRAKAWKLSGDRGGEGLVELHGLLEEPPERLGIVRPFVSPTEENGGVRQPVEMEWDAATFCFQGVNQDNESIVITLGEMKDMARDPWRRQYVGYIMS